MAGEKNIILVGLPSTGKTTFIAALWTLMKAGVQECSLTLNSLKDGDEEYLNDIAAAWATYKEVDRTKTGSAGRVRMNLKLKGTEKIVELNIPDFAGETFAMQFENREWSKDFKNVVENISGVAIFIDPSSTNNIAPTIMSEMAAIKAMELDDAVEETAVDENWEYEDEVVVPETTEAAEYNPRESSNQVKLVEVLQFINMEVVPKIPIKISVIISAWDTVIQTFGAEYRPEKFIKSNLPLLHQFLECNRDIFNADFFGISAQGGKYDNLRELIKKPLNKRVIVYTDSTISEDIALPISSMT